jgi:hypothetical protein
MNELHEQLLSLEPADDMVAMSRPGGGDANWASILSIACSAA